MSFSLGGAAPLAAPPLDYSALVTALRADASDADSNAGDAIQIDLSACSGAYATLNLATVLLGRPGWRNAALAIGGRFTPAGA